MPIETIFRNVEFAANEPLGEWSFPLENFFPRRTPYPLARFACPELGRLLDRLPIQPLVLLENFSLRLLPQLLPRFESALLNQMRLDVVVHEQFLMCRRNF